jgi:hypothetical protein
MADYLHHPASFKDPSGFVFQVNGTYYRQVNTSFAEGYEMLMQSGLYYALTEKEFLITHKEIEENLNISPDSYKTLLPHQLFFISYAYEWSFGQLQDAALLTLKILKTAVDHGMVLKDAAPSNIQFENGKPLFIDTLSFEKYDASKPWVAYRQFCECFLFPLYLQHYLKIDVQKIITAYPDGIPVEVTAKLLPAKSRFNLGIWLHVHLQNSVKRDNNVENKQASFDKKKMFNLVTHLENIIRGFSADTKGKSTWDNYYDETILSQDYLSEKQKIFTAFIDEIKYSTALDAGANNGFFSKLMAKENARVIAIDLDANCINELYSVIRNNNITNILPLCIDLTNPSAATGFMNKERRSFIDRTKTFLVSALALVHHLVLSKNIPLPDVAFFMAALCKETLIIEFVPIDDPKAQELVKNKSRHHVYDEANFEHYFKEEFNIQKKVVIPGTKRILYLMKKNIISE